MSCIDQLSSRVHLTEVFLSCLTLVLVSASQARAETYSYTLTPIASARENCGYNGLFTPPTGCTLPGSYLQLFEAEPRFNYFRVPLRGTVTYDVATGAIGGSFVLQFSVTSFSGLLTVDLDTIAYLDSSFSGASSNGLTGSGSFPGNITVSGGTYDTVGFLTCTEGYPDICVPWVGFEPGTTDTSESDVPFDRTTPASLWNGPPPATPTPLKFQLTASSLGSTFNLQGVSSRTVHLEGVPEPDKLMLLGSGLVNLAFFCRRRSVSSGKGVLVNSHEAG